MQEARFTNQTETQETGARKKKKPLPKDRRRSRRLVLSNPVEVCGESPFNPQTLRGTTRDIDANGVYFVCDESYMVGQLVHVTIHLSGGLLLGSESVTLTLRCRVQRAEELIRNGSKTFGVAVALDE